MWLKLLYFPPHKCVKGEEKMSASAINSKQIAKIWENNSLKWIKLIKTGLNVYNEEVNAPHFFSLLPNVSGLKGLDVGCGTGEITETLASRGAQMTGVDIAPTFISYAKQKAKETSLKVDYLLCDAIELPFADNSFDFVVAVQSLMDIFFYKQAIAEISRVLKKSGFLQFSIPHPCYWTPELKWLYNQDGTKMALVCSDYFSSECIISSWGVEKNQRTFFALKDKDLLETPFFRRTLSDWINTLLSHGFTIKKFIEPKPEENFLKNYPEFDGCNIVAYSLIMQCELEK
jgi:ubiquinone/menaquinone biosynthesis C-methylase UbiE